MEGEIKLPDNLITPKLPTLFESIKRLSNELNFMFADLETHARLVDDLKLLTRVHEKEIENIIKDRFNSLVKVNGELIYESTSEHNITIYLGAHLEDGVVLPGEYVTKMYFNKEYAIV